MDRHTGYACPWGCSRGQERWYIDHDPRSHVGFSEAQAVRDTITVKEAGKYISREITQCPFCGCNVKPHKDGWVKDMGRN